MNLLKVVLFIIQIINSSPLVINLDPAAPRGAIQGSSHETSNESQPQTEYSREFIWPQHEDSEADGNIASIEESKPVKVVPFALDPSADSSLWSSEYVDRCKALRQALADIKLCDLKDIKPAAGVTSVDLGNMGIIKPKCFGRAVTG